MHALTKSQVPSYLETPASPPQIEPPVETRMQELPFGKLPWETFEKLCLRLARSEGEIEFCRTYGERGDDQEGIDLYSRIGSSEKYLVYQCKRVSSFGSGKIRDAVSKFLDGEWADKTEAFVLCTSEALRSKARSDEVEIQRSRLGKEQIRFIVWDQENLNHRLKANPTIVDDFFGRQYVKLFNGEDAASALGERLDVSKIAELRSRLKSFYSHVFAKHDQGVPAVSMGSLEALSLSERYIIPDINDQRRVLAEKEKGQEDSSAEQYGNPLSPLQFDNLHSLPDDRFKNEYDREQATSVRNTALINERRTIEEWLDTSQHNIVLGGPGSGKSALLRFLALDILADAPKLNTLARNWKSYLPVWIPFGRWTKIIDSSGDSSGSLSDLLKSWFEDWGEDKLWPLVNQALEDDRLLILVDGLDEWTKKEAAAIALQRLQVFIEQRDIPAVLTSRPHGYRRLRMGEAAWQVGELADFSPLQQRDLAYSWFYHWSSSSQPNEPSNHSDISRKAEKETDSFINELQRTPDLRDLSKVPLLLSLLISLRLQQASLPRSRFKAYESLIEQLLLKHPKKRRLAAAITDDILPELSDRDLKRAISHLAFYIQTEHPEGLIEDEQAIEVIRGYLKDEEKGLGFRHREAHQLSEEICEVGQDVLGLLVRMSPKQVGFFHRTFLQYLTAYHLSHLPRENQMEVIYERCTDQQWRDVILGQLFLTQRPEDIRAFVGRIKSKKVDTVERHVVDRLLGEIAFGEFGCPTNLARDLAQDTFSCIELGAWKPHRQRLLHNAIDGLRSAAVGRQVKEKLREWFPSLIKWRNGVFEAMKDWPKDSNLRDVLWRGLHDEDISNQRSAAKTLATKYCENDEVFTQLVALVQSASSLDTRSAALESLIEGWVEYEETDKLIQQATKSVTPQLQFLGIKGKVRQGDHDEEDLEVLFDLLDEGLSYQWENSATDLVLKGWPKSDAVKQKCLQRANRFSEYGYTSEFAQIILLAGFPKDKDVVKSCVREIQFKKYPFNGIRHDLWRLLAQNFQDCPKLVRTLDEWIEDQEHHKPQVSFAALVGRTETAKRILINDVQNSWIPFWAARSLLDGWGIQDEKVKDVLSKIAYGPIGEASKIAHLLPDVIKNESTCRDRLFEILRSPECERYDFALEGLIRIEVENASEVVDTILGVAEERWKNSIGSQSVTSLLVEKFPSNPKVRDYAIQQLQDREGRHTIAAIARGFADDIEIRKRVRQLACPLPSGLRDAIAQRLGDGVGSDDFALTLLELYDLEEDASVKTQASIAYHRRLVASGADTSEAEEYLAESIVCYGMDHEDRRQAAFSGILTLGKLDLMIKAEERIGDDKRCAIRIGDRTMLNLPLLRCILENWERLRSTFGNELEYRLTKGQSNTDTFWKTLSILADQYPDARDEATAFFIRQDDKDMNIEALRFLAKVHPGSKLLLDYCLKAMDSYDDRLSLAAAEALGVNFGNGEIPFEIIPTQLLDPVEVPKIVAMCEGWPNSDELSRVVNFMLEEDQRISIKTWTYLTCSHSETEKLYEWIKGWEEQVRKRELNLRDIYLRPVLRRLTNDEELVSLLMKELTGVPTRFQKINYSRMISESRRLTTEIEDWCINELELQLNGSGIPEDSYDLLLQESRPVAHALFDVLDA